jgi:hypothetical protein
MNILHILHYILKIVTFGHFSDFGRPISKEICINQYNIVNKFQSQRPNRTC